MTLKELMNVVEVADSRRALPRHKELLEIGGKVVVKKIFSDGGSICVFEKGYVLMVEGKHYTVFELHKQKNIEFEAVEGKSPVFDITFFEDEEWYVYLLLVGSKRLEQNQYSRKWTSFDSSGLENVLSQKNSDPLNRVIREETEKEVKQKLTVRQQYVMNEYYFENTAQEMIASELGIKQQAVSKCIKKSIQDIRKVLNVEETEIIRIRNKK